MYPPCDLRVSCSKEDRKLQQESITSCLEPWTLSIPTANSHVGYVEDTSCSSITVCVSWKSGLQEIVTLSSCEAEYVAM
jgi:hypothetical protein